MTSQEASTAQRQRLADTVRARMSELHGRTQQEVHAKGGPARQTVRNILEVTGSTPRKDTLTRLDTGLGWMPDSAYDVLWHGKPPRPIEDEPQLSDDLAAKVVALTGTRGPRGPLLRLVQIRDELDKVIDELGGSRE
jgi:hypothetical protein